MRKNFNEFDKKIESLFPKVFETAPMEKVVKRNRMDRTIDFTNYMCKYTSQREKIPKLQREYNLLKVIYGKLSIETPNPIAFEVDESSYLAAFIYEKLQGDILLSVNPPPNQLLEMILELQQLPNYPDVMQIVTEYRPETGIKQILTRENLQKHLTDLNNEQIEIILNFIQLCYNHLKIDKSQKSFFHGDLYFGNILMDRKSDRITGLIDFERGWYADPLIDFSKLSYNDRLLRTLLELYDDRVGIDVDNSMGKVFLYRGLFILRRMIDEWGPDIPNKTKNWIIKPYIEIQDLL